MLDLKNGCAVHAVRGERQHYAPVQGLLGNGGDPLALATAYRDTLGCAQCYVADLDTIAGTGHNYQLLAGLAALGLTLWVDAGVTAGTQAESLAALGVARIIVGSESLASAAQLSLLARSFPPERLVLSVDLQGGVLRTPAELPTPAALVALALSLGIAHVILLDLARVGAAAGPPLDLLAALGPRFPTARFYAGGGVRGPADLEALRAAGAAGALVATAFHQGTLTAQDVRHEPCNNEHLLRKPATQPGVE